MGGFHVYCAICGSTFSSSQFLSIDSDSDMGDYTYSGEVIGDSDLGWLDDLRALGLNPDAVGERKSFVTGDGYYDDAGAIDVDAGEDPNVPIDPDRRPPYRFYTYMAWNDGMQEHIPVFPFHKMCYEDILLRCFKDETLDGDVLYSLCGELVNDCSHNSLLLDYGDPTPRGEQYWECKKGEELLVTNPVKISGLTKYLNKLQDLVNKEIDKAEPEKGPESADIFNKLPYELRQQIFSLLPLASVLALRAASWSMHTTQLPEKSWKKRLESDLPWLWEVHDIDMTGSQKLEAKLSKIIAKLEEKSQYRDGEVNYIPGLANRKRIWMVCEDIRDVYHEQLAENAKSEKSEA
ncbi:hypothetical protein BDV40DRAFT_272152 [Aspergillus tamarii]|uniref:Uncharacterized protein n=1 Tax=Aspergillus tamarii TaxID=41984 RepID=A0A5N6UMU0_ASPTM|nr:hypothetical protein BDV40DRAFT_272152 [Aspergillus tamarii]